MNKDIYSVETRDVNESNLVEHQTVLVGLILRLFFIKSYIFKRQAWAEQGVGIDKNNWMTVFDRFLKRL